MKIDKDYFHHEISPSPINIKYNDSQSIALRGNLWGNFSGILTEIEGQGAVFSRRELKINACDNGNIFLQLESRPEVFPWGQSSKLHHCP